MALMVFKAQTSTSASAPLGTALESLGPFSASRVREKFLLAAPQSRSFGWLGPRPRITRRTDGGRFTTTAVWIGAIPPDTTNTRPFMAGVAEPIAQSIKRELDTVLDTWAVEFTPYAESVHGSLDQWRTGAAADTRTENRFDLLPAEPEGALGAPQGLTPTGDSEAVPAAPPVRPPPTPAPPRMIPRADASGGAADLLLPLAIVFVPVGLAWGLSYARESYSARGNPSRRRRRY